MIKTRTAIALLVVVAGVAAGAWWATRDGEPTARYRSERIERGTIVAAVSASGTINPVGTVQVGSQVSGQIRDVLVDFNDEVKEGQVIARIAPETFEHRVGQAQADLEAARAQVHVQESQVHARRAEVARAGVNLAETRRDLQRKEDLLARNFLSVAERDRALALARAQEQEVNTARAALDVALAQVRNSEAVVRQREAALRAAQVDLGRSVIRSPVDGVVIKRSVEAGQTVAASLQSPELFVIARNLQDMQVDTSIDETDIGRIHTGQPARFSVDAHPGRSFGGEVTQIRIAAVNVQNVITYNVIVTFANPEGLLLPGMTANVRIVTDTRPEVLKVPNAALRVRLPGVVGAPTGPAPPDVASGVAARDSPGGDAAGAHSPAPTMRGRIFVLENGRPRPIDVAVGISDGSHTEVRASGLDEGIDVVVGVEGPPAEPRRRGMRLL